VRRWTTLLAQMVVIGCLHAGFLFIAYGRRWVSYLSPLGVGAEVIWLLLPSCVACCLYYFSLSSADLFTARARRGKLAVCSIAATLFTLYWGVFLSFNTYGT
jgi:hypothetical protein